MATQAIMTEARLGVAGIGGPGEILRMATETVRGCPGKPVADVALNTIQICVRAGQRKCRELRVVYPGAGPGVDAVTLVASGRHVRSLVIRNFGSLVIPRVARTAGRAQADELA